jgi:hypothetical protein
LEYGVADELGVRDDGDRLAAVSRSEAIERTGDSGGGCAR